MLSGDAPAIRMALEHSEWTERECAAAADQYLPAAALLGHLSLLQALLPWASDIDRCALHAILIRLPNATKCADREALSGMVAPQSASAMPRVVLPTCFVHHRLNEDSTVLDNN